MLLVIVRNWRATVAFGENYRSDIILGEFLTYAVGIIALVREQRFLLASIRMTVWSHARLR